jgi:hypothetical protein
VAIVDTGYPGSDCVYDGATVIGPDGTFFPAGIWRDADYGGAWCENYFLDYDDVANTTWPSTAGAANNECPGACCDNSTSDCVDGDDAEFSTGCMGENDRFLKDGFCADFDPSCGTTLFFELNEIYASHSGTDNLEFIEIIGTPGASLDNVMVLVVEGEQPVAGTLDRAWDLTGYTMPGDGYFVLGDTAVTAKDYDLGSDNNLENGTSIYYLILATNPSTVLGLVGTLLDADQDCAYDAGMEITSLGLIMDLVALVDDDVSNDCIYDNATAIGPDPQGPWFPAGIWRDADYPGAWCRNYYLDFDPIVNQTFPSTAGSANGECPGACCFEHPWYKYHGLSRAADVDALPGNRCLDQYQGLYESECTCCPGASRFIKDGLCEDFDPECGQAPPDPGLPGELVMGLDKP